jgi:hypothetical protein
MSNLVIAKTIQHQLMTLGRIKVWSWGAHAWAGGDDFLRFRVQGLKFRGIVKITLDPSDTYVIEFFKLKATEPIKRYEMVYFDDMVDLIDEYVEKIDAYKF